MEANRWPALIFGYAIGLVCGIVAPLLLSVPGLAASTAAVYLVVGAAAGAFLGVLFLAVALVGCVARRLDELVDQFQQLVEAAMSRRVNL